MNIPLGEEKQPNFEGEESVMHLRKTMQVYGMHSLPGGAPFVVPPPHTLSQHLLSLPEILYFVTKTLRSAVSQMMT